MDVQTIEGLFVAFVGGGFWIAASKGVLPLPAFFKDGWKARAVPWIGPVLIAFGVFLMYKPREEQPVDLDALANGIRAKASLPMKVDDVTRLDDVRPVDGALGLFYTLSNITTPDPETGKQLEGNVRKIACANPQYRRVVANNVSVRIVYKTESGAQIASILLEPKDCQ